jgi:hypothetical protein
MVSSMTLRDGAEISLRAVCSLADTKESRRGDLTLHVVLVGLSRQSTCFVASAALDTVNTPENVAQPPAAMIGEQTLDGWLPPLLDRLWSTLAQRCAGGAALPWA